MKRSPKTAGSKRKLIWRNKRTSLMTMAWAALLSTQVMAPRAKAGTEKDVLSGATDLSLAASYNPATTPTVADDITFLAATYTNASSLFLGASVTFGSLNDLNANALTISGNSSTSRTLTLGGAGFSNSVANLNGGATSDLIFVTSGGNLTLSSVTNKVLSVALGASGDFDVAGTGALTIAAPLTGLFSLNKTGTGTLTLSGANTFGGTGTKFTLAAGTLNVNSATALGTTANGFQINGGTTLNNTSGAAITVSTNNALTINGDFTYAGGLTTTLADLSLGTGATNLGTATGTSRTITVTAANSTLTLGGIISNGTTANQLIKSGAGSLLLSGLSTYTGGFNLNVGTLVLGNSSTVTTGTLVSGPVGTGTLQLGTATQAVTLATNSTTTRTINNSVSLNNDITFATTAATGRITLDTNSTLTTANTITLTRTNALTLNTGVTVDLIGAIGAGGNAFGLTKLGAGTLNIGSATDAAANTYTGLTTISAGATTLNKTANTDGIAGNLLINGGTFTLGANSENIKNTSAVTVNTGGTFATGVAKTETIGSLTVGGGTVSGLGTLVIAGAGSTVVSSGTVSTTNLTTGTGGLTLGDGALVSSATTLNGDVAYNGTTTAATFGAGAITLNGSRNFTVADGAAANDLTVSGLISNGTVTLSGVTKLGAGTLLLSGANTFSGGLTIATGTVKAGNATAIGAGLLTIGSAGNSAIFDLNGQATETITGGLTTGGTAANQTITNSGATAGILNFNGAATSTYGGVIQNGTSAVAVTVNNAAANVTLSGNNSYTGITTLTTGTLTLSGNNMTSGQTTLTAGTFNFNSPTAVGTGTLALNGSTLDNTSGAAITNANNNTISIGTGFTFTGTNSLNLGTGAYTLPSGGSPTLNVVANTLTFGGVSNAATTGFIKSGAGTLALNGANLYTGVTTVNNGTLLIGTNNAIKSGNAVSVTTNTAGGTALLNLNGFNLTLSQGTNALTLGGATGATATSVANVIGAGSTLTLTSGVQYLNTGSPLGSTISVSTLDLGGTAALTFSVADSPTAAADLTVSSVIQNGGINKTGSGNLVLTGANTYAGTTAVTAGTLTLSGNNTTSGTTTVATGTTLNINSATALGTGALTITGAGFLDNTSGAALTEANNNTINLSSSFTFTGSNALNLGGGTYSLGGANPTITVAANTLTFGGVVTGTGTLAKSGAGTLVLGGANTFTGGLIINAGTAQLANASALTAANTVTFGASAASSARLQLNGNSVTIGALSTNAIPGTPVVENGGATDATLTESTAAGSTFAGVIQNGAGTGTLSLVKGGAGILVLSGANTYTGTTTINGGSQLNLGAGGTTGSLSTSSIITDNGILGFNRTDSVAQGTDFNGSGISGSGGVSKSGAGMLTLNAGTGNTYQGATTINAGTLAFSSNSLNSTSSVALNATGVTLQYLANTTDDLSGKITENGINGGSGAIINIGSNNVTFASTITNNQSAGIRFTGNAGAVLSLTGTTNIVSNGGTIVVDTIEADLNKTGAATFPNSFTVQNNGTLKLFGTTAASNTGGTALSLFTINTGGKLDLNGSTLTLQGLAGDSTALITNGATGTTSTVSFQYSGSGVYAGTIQDGAGVVAIDYTPDRATTETFSGNNTYSGGTVLNGDGTSTHQPVLLLGSNTALGTGQVTIGGLSYLSSDSTTARSLANNVVLSGGTAAFGFGTNTGALTFGTLTATSSTPTVSVGNTQTTFSSASLTGLTKSGSGILYIPGTYANSGTTTISGGTLALAGNNSGNGTVTIGDSGTLQLIANAGNTSGGVSSAFGSTALSINSTPTIQLRSDSDVTFTLPSFSGGGGNNTPITFDLGSPTGSTTGHTISLPSATTITTGSGSDHPTTFSVTGTSGYALNVGTLAVEGANTALQSVTVASGLTLNLATLTNGSNAKGLAPLRFNGAGTTNIAALTAISSSSFNTTITAGTVNLNGVNNLYGTSPTVQSPLTPGQVNVTGGTLNLGNAGALNVAHAGSVANLVLSNATFDNTGTGANAYTTLSQNITQNWNGDFAFTGTNSLNTGTGAVTIGGTGVTRTVTVNANTLAVGGVGEAAGAGNGLTKAGAGTLAINGTSTYTGATNVTAGTLLVNGSHTTGGAYAVVGGSLGGTNGAIDTGANAISIGNGTTGGTITGGGVGTVGMLTLATTDANGVFLNGGSGSLSIYQADTGDTTTDLLTITGILNLSGTNDQLVINNTGNLAGGTYQLATYSSLMGTFDSVVGLNDNESLVYNVNGMELDLVVAVPEPGTWAGAVGCLGLMVFARRRLSRKAA